jgi:flotillin
MFGLSIAIIVIVFVAIFLFLILFWASRYKRCPSDKILVIYGRVGKGQSSKCIHGGGAFIWPLIQGYSWMSLTPVTISIPLQNALSLQNIRINVPSTFTVGISTDSAIMQNAAVRLLGLGIERIEEMSREIIFGQLRLTVASLTIEQINQDRESFLESIRKNVEPELNKIGLYLINVNITDITDESTYIESIGKKSASEAINRARIDVAEQEKIGAIGQANANREKDVSVAEAEAEAAKGKKKAEAEQRVFIQKQESNAAIGEAEANREMSIRIAETEADAAKGRKKAEAEQRIFVQQQESQAIEGENTAKAAIAAANAELQVKQAEALQLSEIARKRAEVEIQKAQYLAEMERLNAAEVAQQEIAKKKMEITAEANAERIRREAKGDADAILMKYEAEAKGILQVLEAKAKGYQFLLKSCDGDAEAATSLLLIEKLQDIVKLQVEAIKNIKIDKVTVWDSGDKNATPNFLSGFIKSLPPLQDVMKMAGIQLPSYLGEQIAEKTNQATQNQPSDNKK